MGDAAKVRDDVKNYYGEVLSSNKDLKTNACCSFETLPQHVRKVAPLIHEEVLNKFYGCGSPIPAFVDNCRVLDLGCGTGRDCFILSKLVGESGQVIGLDMTEQQLAVARQHLDYHTKQFGYSAPNLEFKQGLIEDLKAAGIESDSLDLVISNCVINLAANKRQVFSEIFRVLKPGGELYFSDVFSSRRISEDLANDALLRGECLSGAMYIEDFRRLLAELGCSDYRVISNRSVTPSDPEIVSKTGEIQFYSMTIRAFKLAQLEDRCEDYGQVAVYRGTIEESPNSFILDDHHLFEKNKPMAVCMNTALMLSKTRYAKHFEITGDGENHYGLFDCGQGATNSLSSEEKLDAGGCC